MIGIDITKISRFNPNRLNRYNKKFGTNYSTVKEVAKYWACFEALIKAEGRYLNFKDVSIEFSPNQSPRLRGDFGVLNHNYILTLSHEDDLIVAIAMRK